MRFPAKPLTTGTKVPANPADVAQGLTVEWDHDNNTHTSFATVDNVLLTARSDGMWTLRKVVHGVTSEHFAAGACRERNPKRAAVLALAQHLVDQRKPKTWTPANLGTLRTHLVPSDDGKTMIDLAKPVEAKPFKVGDRVRLVRKAVRLWPQLNIEWTIKELVNHTAALVDDVGVSDHLDTNWLEHVKIEHAPAPKWEWSAVTEGANVGSAFVKGPDGSDRMGCHVDVEGFRWYVQHAFNGNLYHQGPCATLDEAKAAAEAAYEKMTAKA